MDLSKIVFNQLFTLAVPESELSDEGIGILLENLHYMTNLSADRFREKLPKDWSWLAKVEHGTYAGTISKRIQSYLFKAHDIKLGENDVAALGNLAAQHVLDAREFYFDFDENLKWKAGEYGDKGSCFWTQKPHVLPLLKHFGGFSIRLYDRDTEKRKGIGRALIMPLVAGKDGYQPDQFRNPLGLLVFNGYGSFGKNYGKSSVSSQTYGQMQVYDYARLLALFLGVSYERVMLAVNGSYEYPLYVNNQGTAVLVAPTETIQPYKAQGRVGHKTYRALQPYWSEERIAEVIVMCDRCRTTLTLDGPEPNGKRAPDGHKYCLGCYERFYRACYVDGREFPKDALHALSAPALHLDNDVIYVCREHFVDQHFTCGWCQRNYHLSERLYYHVPNGEGTPARQPICRRCYHDALMVSPCPVCTRDYAAEVLRHQVEQRMELGPCPECKAKGAAGLKDGGEGWRYLAPQPLPVPEPVDDVRPKQKLKYMAVDVEQAMRANWNLQVPVIEPEPELPVQDWDVVVPDAALVYIRRTATEVRDWLMNHALQAEMTVQVADVVVDPNTQPHLRAAMDFYLEDHGLRYRTHRVDLIAHREVGHYTLRYTLRRV